MIENTETSTHISDPNIKVITEGPETTWVISPSIFRNLYSIYKNFYWDNHIDNTNKRIVPYHLKQSEMAKEAEIENKLQRVDGAPECIDRVLEHMDISEQGDNNDRVTENVASSTSTSDIIRERLRIKLEEKCSTPDSTTEPSTSTDNKVSIAVITFHNFVLSLLHFALLYFPF